jgi:hypothetical protein
MDVARGGRELRLTCWCIGSDSGRPTLAASIPLHIQNTPPPSLTSTHQPHPPSPNTHEPKQNKTKQNQVGDILVQGERGAHIIMAPEVAEYITGTLASVRSVPVKNSPIPLAELGVRPPVKKEVRGGVVCV